jgi:hypothetical protein
LSALHLGETDRPLSITAISPHGFDLAEKYNAPMVLLPLSCLLRIPSDGVSQTTRARLQQIDIYFWADAWRCPWRNQPLAGALDCLLTIDHT